MTTDGGGNPRFKGSGMLWKTSWKRHQPLLDMDFFTNFFSPTFPLKSWYQSTAAGGDAWFFGNASPGFTIGGIIMLPQGFTTATAINIGKRSGAGPARGWSLAINTSLHLIASYALTSNVFVTLDGGAITPGFAWPFYLDVFDDSTETTGRLYVPVPGNLAHVAATNTAAPAVYYNPPLLADPFSLGFTGNGIYINGLAIGPSVITTGVLPADVEAFFQYVKDNMTLPVLDNNSDTYVDATLVYPNAPLNYTTGSPPAGNLNQTFGGGGSATIQNVARTVSFAY